jgi:hypothetical protein
MVKDINLNLKLKVCEKTSPLKIFISYPGAKLKAGPGGVAALKSLQVYLSYENKEPSK